MAGSFAGRNAVVTGASRGIGAGIAERLAAEGANVAITARTVDAHPTLPGSLNETLARLQSYGGTHLAIAADMADAEDRARIIPEARAALGPIDILVNNAAAAIYQPITDYPLKRRRLMTEVNFQGPIDLMQASIPDMVERGEGWIVNVSSATAKLAEGPPFANADNLATMVVYGATKAALNRATNGMALAVHGTGVRVNTIEPRAAVLSPGADVLVGSRLSPDQIESLEAMVEATIALCGCGPDTTGRVCSSLDLLDELGRTVMTLDGTAPYPGGQRPVQD